LTTLNEQLETSVLVIKDAVTLLDGYDLVANADHLALTVANVIGIST
jgi:hypothetical protein